ncbi:MAG TPA: phosphate ABC transporter substrate-binding protein PstS [Steroidobacteraceae bacterium]|nr:phosphate ABC transporter substrate-binding protein PstS [Steroidobacteraceae bacterium]
MKRLGVPLGVALAFALALGLAAPLATPAGVACAADLTLTETGSTLLYPLFQRWVADFTHTAPQITLRAAPTGSGAGIQAAIDGSAQIGASDAYMSDEQAEQNRQIVNIPVAISAQTVNYNLPGLNSAGLKLDGPTLAGIYFGRIDYWDARPIAALNPGLALPHQRIIPIRRADASGDSFIFTQFLDFSTQEWEDRVGYGTSVAWPTVPAERTASGNAAMVQSLAATPYGIAYIGISFGDAIARAALGTARLENQSGQFLLPSAETVGAAASTLDSRTPPDERLSLVFAPGPRSYPLINYEYVVVSTHQRDAATAAALRRFLLWTISLQGGNASAYLDAVGFIPLPDFIRGMSEHQINLIGPGNLPSG